MSLRKPLIGLCLFLIMTTVATWMVSVTLGRGVGGPTRTYTAQFTDVTGLKSGDDVRVAGVRVGRVDDVELDGAVARVTFQVHDDQTLYDSTGAAIMYQNIIGQRYVALTPGEPSSGRPLPAGSEIPLERTEPSFDITYLLRGFEPLFALLDPEQVDNLTTAVIAALQGNNGSLLTLITETSSLSELLAGPDQLLDEVITNLNHVVVDLSHRNSDLQSVIAQSSEILTGLEARRGDLRASVGSINSAVSRLAEISEAVYPDLREWVTREPGLAAHLTGEGRERIAFYGANLPLVLKGLARFTQEGSYGNIYACDITSNLFAFLSRLIPAVVRHATPGNTIKHSPVCR